jgi:diguanylate cyclase (GGDEF)-like protein
MPAVTKGQNHQDVRSLAGAQGWGVFLPAAADEHEPGGLVETRAALQQAEIVMRAQEERIRLLEQLALTDELTGLANRRGFATAFDRELALARRDANYGGVLVMIDLDGFKAINDKWGHQAGDAYLRIVAEVLQDGVRSTDIVARLGGDEFALLLSRMSEKNGAKRVAKLEQAFGKRAMMLRESIPLRASFGFATYGCGSKVEAVMHAADLKLYEQKTRNKAMVAA